MTQDKNNGNGHPNPDVKPGDVRRHFGAEEKLNILEEVEACKRGEVGAVLRRHGIYSSYLTRRRRARDRGELDGLGGKNVGRNARCPKSLRKSETCSRR